MRIAFGLNYESLLTSYEMLKNRLFLCFVHEILFIYKFFMNLDSKRLRQKTSINLKLFSSVCNNSKNLCKMIFDMQYKLKKTWETNKINLIYLTPFVQKTSTKFNYFIVYRDVILPLSKILKQNLYFLQLQHNS